MGEVKVNDLCTGVAVCYLHLSGEAIILASFKVLMAEEGVLMRD